MIMKIKQKIHGFDKKSGSFISGFDDFWISLIFEYYLRILLLLHRISFTRIHFTCIYNYYYLYKIEVFR